MKRTQKHFNQNKLPYFQSDPLSFIDEEQEIDFTGHSHLDILTELIHKLSANESMRDDINKNTAKLEFRDVSGSNEMQTICEMEYGSVCTKEILCYRYIFEKSYLKVMTLNNGDIIGFVSGKRIRSIQSHNEYKLYIDIIFIDTKYSRQGYGTIMMKKYLIEQIKNAKMNEIVNIELSSPQSFFVCIF